MTSLTHTMILQFVCTYPSLGLTAIYKYRFFLETKGSSYGCRCIARQRMEMLQIGPTNRSKELFSSDTGNILECCGNDCCKKFEAPKQFTSSPPFWLWLCLAMFVISSTSTLSLHLTLISNKSGPFHKFLKIFSTGPLQTTQFIQGILVPKIVYRNQELRYW